MYHNNPKVKQPSFPCSVLRQQFPRSLKPWTNAPNSSLPRLENELYRQITKVQAADDGSKPFPESPWDVSNFTSRAELFFFSGTVFEVREVLHSKRGSMLENVVIHDLLSGNVQLFGEQEKYEDRTDTARSLTVAWDRFSQTVCIVHLYSSAAPCVG